MTDVAKKFEREVKLSNLSRRVPNPRASCCRSIKRQVNSNGYDKRTSCSIDVVAGFAERRRSRRRPVGHDFLDPPRAVALGSRRRCNSTATRLNRPLPDRLGGDAISQRPNTGARPWSRLTQRLLRCCQGATLSAVPRTAKRPRNEMVPIGRFRIEAAQIREQRRQPLRASADQREVSGFRSLATEQDKVRLAMIKGRLGS
jgi:hypothetical protein